MYLQINLIAYAPEIISASWPRYWTSAVSSDKYWHILWINQPLQRQAEYNERLSVKQPATRFQPPSATVVFAELFSHGTRTLQCLQKEMATYRHWSVSLWRDPDDVSHCRILFPDKTEWQLISATLCGWRRCFMADQLWLMTRIREEEEVKLLSTCMKLK